MVADDSHNDIAISVILPVRNEAQDIEATLAAVITQTLPKDQYAIVVADGGSTDGTMDLVREFVSRAQPLGLRIELLTNPKGTAAAGLNVAMEANTAPVLVRIDGHTVVDPNYLECVLAALKESGADCVGGLQKPQSEKPWGRAYALATGSLAGSGGAAFRSDQQAQFVDTVYLGAWPRKTFVSFGNFDESLLRNQDDEHNMRIRSQGGRVYLDPKIRSRYCPRESAGGLWAQYFGYGLWKPVVLRKHRGALRLRHCLPPLVVLWLLITGVGAAVSGGWLTALHFASVGTYCGLLLLFSLVLVVRCRTLALLPFVFLTQLILHMSYGSGFLLGLIFRRRSTTSEPSEVQRIRGSYASRDAKPQESPIVQDFLDAGRSRVRGALLEGRVGQTDKILDVGCGRGDWLVALRELGAHESALVGIDLSESRVVEAQVRLPRATFHQNCASSLPMADETVDGVVISLVFSSIQDEAMSCRIVDEAWRVLRPGGWLLVHDMRWHRPRSDTRRFPIAALKGLLGPRRYAITVNSLTLIPPLMRCTIRWAPRLASWLEGVSCLRSHWMARIDKEFR